MREVVEPRVVKWDTILSYWASQQVIGIDFSENYPGVATLALAVGSRAGWVGYEGSSKVNTRKLSLQAAETPSRSRMI